MYQLINEDLTNLGGPPGRNHSTEHSMGHFRKLSKAKEAAEKDYGKKISWKKIKNGYRSPDMDNVMYHIKEIKFKD